MGSRPMRYLPSLNALRAFEAAARHESFHHAAEELHVTASAISHQVRGLESVLQTTLFLRRTRQVVLTDSGRRLLEGVRDGLDRIGEAVAAVTPRPEDPVLTVSTVPFFASGWLIPRLADFQSRYPAYQVRLETSVDLVDVELADVDMAIRYLSRPPAANLETRFLFHERLTVVCSPALAERLKTPEDLTGVTHIQTRLRPEGWRAWLTPRGLAHLDDGSGPTFDNDTLALEAVMTGLGVAITHQEIAHPLIASGRLIEPFGAGHVIGLSCYWVSTHRRSRLPKVVAFRDWLLERLADEGLLDADRPTHR
ncbi:LysR substrate-binding domain-containing protein [Salinicola lusitanus]|uniref:LysR substrate-binding domain-containing protein n=1 Tax=Salinicola lusitanus TaxID=1949085 RepID=UPI0013901EF4|nr:LysR substrate-binding domain-containing protein [Salinicola lusitanus]